LCGEDNGEIISGDLKEWGEILETITEKACYNGTDVYGWELTGFVRCDNCGERLRSNPQVPKDKKKKIHCYYRCPPCGMLVPKVLFEESFTSVHDSLFKDPDEIRRLHKRDLALEEETGARLKELGTIRKRLDKEISAFEHNMSENFRKEGFSLNNKLAEKINKDYGELLISREQVVAEINKLENGKQYRTDVLDPSRNKALAMAIRFRTTLGLKNTSLEFRREFIGALYPKGSKEHCIKVGKVNGQFYWKATGILNDSNMQGVFKTMTKNALKELKNEVPLQLPYFRVVERVLGRQPNEEEVKCLKNHGLIHKPEWYKQDIEYL
jgi:hypothetical protein